MRKINLLSTESKNEFLISNLTKGIIVISVILLIFIGVQGAKTVKTYFDLETVQENNTEIQRLKSSIENIKIEEQKQITVLQNIEEIRFPFYEFTNFLISVLPDEVIIVSLDSENMLVNVNKNVELQKTTMTDPNDGSKTIVVNSNAEIEDAMGNIIGNVDPSVLPEGFYKGDTSSGKIEDLVVRGYSQDNNAIAELFYSISVLPYVKSANITAIEEKTIDEVRQNVFEFRLKFS